jgi:16S rRNA (cytosine(1402)-N(4))-methyltransferase
VADDEAVKNHEPRIPNPEPRAGHRPVLLKEALEFLNVRPDGIYIDATLGGGGHAEAILKVLQPGQGKLLGIDCDPAALAVARERLQGFGEKLIVLEGNFAEIDTLHAASGLGPADGLLADLGLSSLQLEDASRGFSFSLPGPLDMRMAPAATTTAEAIVNQAPERDLAHSASYCEGPSDSKNHRTGAGGDAIHPLPGGPPPNSSGNAYLPGVASGCEPRA